MDANGARDRIVRRQCGRLIGLKKTASINRCNRLLAEFLRDQSSHQQVNSEERSDQTAENLEIRVRNQVMLPEDLLFKILFLLPVESLVRVQFVCKNWFSLVNSSFFIKRHVLESETVLMCKNLALSPLLFRENPKPYFHFLNLNRVSDKFIESSVNDSFHILASCNGLVLAKMENNKCLILTNPVTRKYTELPLSTNNGLSYDSYSLVFCDDAKTYKVVHSFCEKTTYIDCEVMSISTRTWKKVEGLQCESFQYKQIPVSINGSLYWMPRKHGCGYYVAMNVWDEKFIIKKLPTSCTVNDRILEIGGVLGLVTHAIHNQMEVWILTNCGDVKDNWVKRYSINLNFGFGYSPIPICSARNGKELVFGYLGGRHLYVYEFDEGDMKLVYSRDDIEAWDESIEKYYIPHRNTFASWEA